MENKGQHELINRTIMKLSIDSAEINSEDVVLEIGAGKGNLTKQIISCNPKKIIAIELDQKYEKELNKIKNAEIIIGNALEIIPQIEFTKIVANIPYQISEPLLGIIIKKQPKTVVLLTGASFYEVLTKQTRIGTITRSMYNITFIAEVSPEYFNPQPRIKSVLFKLEKKEQTDNDKIISEIGKQEDKTVKNAIIEAQTRVLKMTKKEAADKTKKIPSKLLDKRIRHLSNHQFEELIKKIF